MHPAKQHKEISAAKGAAMAQKMSQCLSSSSVWGSATGMVTSILVVAFIMADMATATIWVVLGRIEAAVMGPGDPRSWPAVDVDECTDVDECVDDDECVDVEEEGEFSGGTTGTKAKNDSQPGNISRFF